KGRSRVTLAASQASGDRAMRRRFLCALGVVLVCAGVVGWLARDRVFAYYYVFQLTRAAEPDAERWIGEAPRWGGEVGPALLAEWTSDEAGRCRRAGAALVAIHRDSIPDLGAVFAARYEQTSAAGQEWMLEQAASWDADAGRQLVASALR